MDRKEFLEMEEKCKTVNEMNGEIDGIKDMIENFADRKHETVGKKFRKFYFFDSYQEECTFTKELFNDFLDVLQKRKRELIEQFESL